MVEPDSGPPERKEQIPRYIDDIFDNRDKHNFPNFTAAQIAQLLSDIEEYEGIEEVHPETVRNWLNKMIEGEVTTADGETYDIEKFKLGPRTVVYGRSSDPQRVAADGGFDLPTLQDMMYVNYKVVSLFAAIGLVLGLYIFDSVMAGGVGLGLGLIMGALLVPFIYGLAILADMVSTLSTRGLLSYRQLSGGIELRNRGPGGSN